ncbi:putative metal-binding motif-containing protein, partial [Candidatus Woesearchaeota archaeon]|nr:putative metal-binding motif-containing protein [Candidatus Woesearchaeota archaeon]
MNKRICCWSLFVCLLFIFSVVAVAIPTSVTPKNTEPVVRKFLVKSYGVNAFTGKSINLITGRQAALGCVKGRDASGIEYGIEHGVLCYNSVDDDCDGFVDGLDATNCLYRVEFGFSFPNAQKEDVKYVSEVNKDVGLRFFVKQRFFEQHATPVPPSVPVNFVVDVFDSSNSKVLSESGVLPSAFLEGYPEGSNFPAAPCQQAEQRVEDDKYAVFTTPPSSESRPHILAGYERLRKWYEDMTHWCHAYLSDPGFYGGGSNFIRKTVGLTSSLRRLVPGVYKVRWTLDEENKLVGDIYGVRGSIQQASSGGSDPQGHVREFTLQINPSLDTYVNGQLNRNINWINPPEPVVAAVPPQVVPTAPVEVCNFLDDNNDGQIDEGLSLHTYYRDADGDGFGNPSVSEQTCSARTGFVSNNQDCNDANAAINPSVQEVCNNAVDDNCVGGVDEGCAAASVPPPGDEPTPPAEEQPACVPVTTGTDVGECQVEIKECQNGVLVTTQQGITPQVERCNASDDDCDGSVDEELGSSTCGFAACTVTVDNCVGGLSQTCTPDLTKSSPETGGACLNTVDDDCDNFVDGADPDCVPAQPACVPVTTGTDVGECQVEIKICQNGALVLTQAGIGPQTEICNQLDDNCDGEVDEFCVTADCGSADAGFNAVKSQFAPVKQQYITGLRPIQDYNVRCASLVGDAQKQCWTELSVIGRNFEPTRIEFKNLNTLFLQKQVVADQACNRCLSDEICGNDFDDNCDGKVYQVCKTAECFLAEKTLVRVEGEYEQLSQQVQASPANVILSAQLAELKRVRDEKRTAKNNACACVSSAEVCDGRDNDCDGQIDEALAVPLACGVGACKRDVVSACVSGEAQYCVPGVPAAVENCKNAVDDDCDGFADLDDSDCSQCVQKITERGVLIKQHSDKVVEHALAEFRLNNARNECYDSFPLHRDRIVLRECIAGKTAQFGPDVARLAGERDALAAKISAIDNDPLLGNCPFDSLYVYDGKCLKSGCLKTMLSYAPDPTIGGCAAFAPKGMMGADRLLEFKVLAPPVADVSYKLIGGPWVRCTLNPGTSSEHIIDSNSGDSCHSEFTVQIPKEKILVGADKTNVFQCGAGDLRGGNRII